MNDSLRRNDITLFDNASNPVGKKRAKKVTLHCALVNGYYASRFHSKARANRVVRLLKHYGKDAYLSGPVTRTV